MAAAQCYYSLGWKMRGEKYAIETKKEQFDGMKDYFSMAEASLMTAIRLKPNLMPAFDVLIGLYNSSGQDEKKRMWRLLSPLSVFPSRT